MLFDALIKKMKEFLLDKNGESYKKLHSDKIVFMIHLVKRIQSGIIAVLNRPV